MPSDKSEAVDRNAETIELLQKYKTDFPKSPDPAKVWNQSCKNNFKRELDDYNNGHETRGKIPRYFLEIGPLKYQNFVKHLLKNLRQLENVANSVYMDHERQISEKLYSEFQAETDLKSAIEREIASIPSFADSSSDWNQKSKSRREFLMGNETEVQAILKTSSTSVDEPPSEKVKTEGYPLTDLWRDKWHPINLTLSYDMFKRFMNLIILQRKSTLKDFHEDKNLENVYKRHYLRYMFKCAESNQEFALAVISFGTDARFYPSKVIEFFQARGMLNEEFNALKAPKSLTQKDMTFSKAPDSVVPKRNEKFLEKFNRNPMDRLSKPLIQIVKLVDLTEDVAVDNQANNFHGESFSKRKTDSDKRQSNKPGGWSEKQTKKSPGSTSNRNIVRENSKITVDKYKGKSGNETIIKRIPSIQPKNIIKTITQAVPKSTRNTEEWAYAKKTTMPELAFKEATQKLWQMFYEPGFTLSFAVSSTWYKRYFNHLKTNKEQLNNCVEKLLQDRQKSCHYDIPRLHPGIIDSIKKDFGSLEIVRRNTGGLFNMSNVKGIMSSQTSPLQLALQDPTFNKAVPGPNDWSPTTCDMPYQGFEGHLSWRLKEVGKALDGLEIEMVKLRFAECMSIVYSDLRYCKQFILSIFTAYGPDLYLYPTRVLQLLKKKQVIRSSSKLHSIIQIPVDARTYSSLVPIQNQSSMVPGDSLLGGPPPFALNMMMPGPGPHMVPQAPPSFQPFDQIPPAQSIPTHMGMNHSQFGYENPRPPHFQPPPVQYPHSQPGPPMNDFSNGYPPQGQYGNNYQGPPPDPYINQPQQDPHFMNPKPVPPPFSQITSNVNNSKAPQPRLEPVKPNALPSVLPLELWKSSCTRSLAKYGPKYGIRPLNDKDYKVLYDRYLFDTFDNPDDFVRGILTGISLARYPRDDDPISTSGLLQLPSGTVSAETASKATLKPILKLPSIGPNNNPTISMTREDLIRVSSLLEKLIPSVASSVNATGGNEASAPLPPRRVQQKQDEPRLYDYQHDGHERDKFDVNDFRRPRTAAPVAPPIRRNYEEEERGYEQSRRAENYDYANPDRASSSASMNSDYYRRESGTSGIGSQAPPSGVMNPMKRPALTHDPYEEEVFRKRMSYSEYDY